MVFQVRVLNAFAVKYIEALKILKSKYLYLCKLLFTPKNGTTKRMKFTKKESFTAETLEFAKNLSLQTLTSVPSACLCEHADRRLSGESSRVSLLTVR
jgi:hypothetical protein